MIEAIVASCALGALAFLSYILKKRSTKKPWSFLSRWKLSGKAAPTRMFASSRENTNDHPMASWHLESKCSDSFKGVQDLDIAREPAGAFIHLESVLNRIQSRFLSHHSRGSKMLLGDTLIDQKAFMDCFRSEKEAIVALYHCNEDRVIFVSANVKKLLGYTPGDFRLHFHEILHDDSSWRQLLTELRSRHKIYAPVALYRVQDHAHSSLSAWDAYLGHVQRGSLHYAAVLFYPAFCQVKR